MDDLYYYPVDPNLQHGQGVSRAQIEEFGAKIMELEHLRLELPIAHHFSKGLYCRQMFLPKDSTNISRIHKYPSLSIIAQGKVAVASEFSTEIYEAPRVIVAPAGIQRCVHALEDSCWITVHENPNELRDPDELADELTVAHWRELPAPIRKQLEASA